MKTFDGRTDMFRNFLSSQIEARFLKQAWFVFGGLIVFSFAFLAFAGENQNSDKNIFQDADQDGLSNAEEVLYKTDPYKADTDGDGYSDGVEVESGYDPTKPAPGDRVAQDQTQSKDDQLKSDGAMSEEPNLTEKVSTQVAGMIKESSVGNGQLSLSDIQSSIQSVLDKQSTDIVLPEVDASKIKVKKQKYDKLPSEERDQKIKQDTLEYVTAVIYVMVNNAPVAVHSGDDFEGLFNSLTVQAISAISTQNGSLLDGVVDKSAQSLEQLQSIEVPENMLETHVKALQIAEYASTLKSDIKPRSNDPLSTIAALAKVQGFMNISQGFMEQLQGKLTEYGISVKDLPLAP